MVAPCLSCSRCWWCETEGPELVIYHILGVQLVEIDTLHEEEVYEDCLQKAGLLW